MKLLVAGFPAGVDGPWHWLSRGVVSVYLSIEPDPASLPVGSSLIKSGQGWRLDLPVSPVRVDSPAADQVRAITEAVTAAVRLRHWGTEQRTRSI